MYNHIIDYFETISGKNVSYKVCITGNDFQFGFFILSKTIKTKATATQKNINAGFLFWMASNRAIPKKSI